MANPTTNFGWVMPTSTSLVTNLPADFNTFGQAVDTSMSQLKGGTTGQILSKTSATDMAFTWITNDVGDITAVNTTAPLAGGGTSGALTLSIASATTAVVGAVQLSDSTSTTSSVLAATPTAVKSAYDLADGAIAKTTVTTAGDIIYRNATVPVRLGIGTANQVLRVNSGATAPEWATISTSPTFVGCSLYKNTTAQTLSSGTATAISFNAEEFDTDAFHDNSTNNTRITIPTGKGGKYIIISAIVFASNTTGIRTISIYKNGSSLLDTYQHAPTPSAAARCEVTNILSLNAGDYIETYAAQQSGGNLDVNAEQGGTRFAVIYLGA